MKFLRFNLINKHGVSDHQGEVLIRPFEIESIRSFIHTDHVTLATKIGAVVTMKTGDKHHVSQHTNKIAEMLRLIDELEADSSMP